MTDAFVWKDTSEAKTGAGIYVGIADAAPPANRVGEVTSATLTGKVGTIDVANLDVSGYDEFLAGNWSGDLKVTCNYLVADTNGQNAVRAANFAGETISILMAYDGLATYGHYGNCIITDLSVPAKVGDRLTCSFTAKISGTMTPVVPA